MEEGSQTYLKSSLEESKQQKHHIRVLQGWKKDKLNIIDKEEQETHAWTLKHAIIVNIQKVLC